MKPSTGEENKLNHMENTVTNEDTPKIARIGTKNFSDYLIGMTFSNGEKLRGDIDDFEKQIEVPEVIHNSIKEMYEQQQEADLTGPSYELRRQRLIKEMEKYSSGLGEALDGVSPQKGLAEQARVIYSDLDNDEIKSTKSVFGHGYEVDPRDVLTEAANNNGVPLMLVHTHPEDVFFSPQDFALMMVKISSENISARLMNAGIVLLPDMQIMAIATADTPMVTGMETGNIIGSKNEAMEMGTTDILKKGLDLLNQIHERRKVVEGVAAIKEAVGKENEAIVEEVAKKFNILEGESEMLEKLQQNNEKDTRDEGARFHNSELVGFAKEIGIKLYFSQDMRTFKEFSA